MKKAANFSMAILCGMSLILTSCSKEGPAGPAGADGNANVKSTTFTISPGDWSAFGTFGESGYGFGVQKNTTLITQDIVDNGAVMVYLQSGSLWISMPLTLSFDGWESNFIPAHGVGYVQVELYDSDLETVAPTGAFNIKVVALSASQVKDYKGDLNNYEQLSKAFELEGQ